MEAFREGWDFESEEADYNALRDFQEYCGGEQFVFEWSDVKDRIYAEAKLHTEWDIRSELCNYTIAQTKTNGCVGYGVSAGIEDTLDMMQQKGKEVEVFRSCAPWLYGGYHNIIKGRPGTGGCSMAGMLQFIAKYGILPYDTQPKIYADGEVDWNKNPKSWKQVYEKYGATAEQFQIKVAKLPRSFADISACLKAGYAIPYGTNKKLVLDKKTGWYRLSGNTMHCMCWSGFGDGFTYNKNSWLDGRGKLRVEDVMKMVASNYFDAFVVLEIKRTRKSKPNYAL